MATAYDAIIFDMDSTLLDSFPAILRCWTAFAHRYGLTEEQLRSQFGHSTAEIVAEFVAPEQRAEALDWINARELSDQEGVHALPGAADALAAAAGRGAVATSATRPMALARMGAAGVPVPQVLVTASDVQRAKPDPQLFLRAAEELGVEPARCLVVEDAPAGLVAARRGGMATVAVCTTHGAQELRELADVVVPDLSAVQVVRRDRGVLVDFAPVG